jgi:hypothetical protein
MKSSLFVVAMVAVVGSAVGCAAATTHLEGGVELGDGWGGGSGEGETSGAGDAEGFILPAHSVVMIPMPVDDVAPAPGTTTGAGGAPGVAGSTSSAVSSSASSSSSSASSSASTGTGPVLCEVCCGDVECADGESCVGGTCIVVPPPVCDAGTCASECQASCNATGKLGIGACVNDACFCQCF